MFLLIWSVLVLRHVWMHNQALAARRAQRILSQPHVLESALLRTSATELARMIRTGKVSSTTVVKAYIDQIRRVNKALNAMVFDRFAEALHEAEVADALAASDSKMERPPFYGVPCTVKEAFAVSGCPNSSGLHARRDVFSTEDAESVAALKRAGFIILGVTNVSELCMWQVRCVWWWFSLVSHNSKVTVPGIVECGIWPNSECVQCGENQRRF